MIDLPILPITDFSRLCMYDKVTIEICNSLYRFSPDAQISGTDERFHPIFGSKVYINDKLIYNLDYGLPTLLFEKGLCPRINFVNKTKFTSNLHFHGLINTGLVDGASSYSVFGPSTLLGENIQLQFPKIRNNSALTWYHSHAMFRSIQLACAGMVGTVLITDDFSKQLDGYFVYGKNYFVLTLLDVDLDSKGRQVLSNLSVDVNRSSFTVINGISTVQWYTKSDTPVPYSNVLNHVTNKNLVKIDLINFGSNWRVYYLGVCDQKRNILPFYVVQTDQGFCQPVKTTLQYIPVGGRISIIVDLTTVSDAQVFFYDYDLTENLGINPDGTGVFPDYSLESSTPYPTPVPDPNNENQQSIETTLNYPVLPLIPQVNLPLNSGIGPIPNTNFIRPFLNIGKEIKFSCCEISLDKILKKINYIVFKSCTKTNPDDYLPSLNPRYFYNLPKVENTTPNRNICLWGENDLNYIKGEPLNPYIIGPNGDNLYGVTETCDGANRIMVDLWNSNELDLDEALLEYSKNPNNYKPSKLPTSDFKITKKNDEYINLTMVSNDELYIELFNEPITYGDKLTLPIGKVKIFLPPTNVFDDLNIQQWINLLNETMHTNFVKIKGDTVKLSDLLYFDWSFFPYAINLLDGTIKYLKSAVIKSVNNSTYNIRLLGRWQLLQMLGKSMVGNKNFVPPTPGSGPCCDINSPCDEELLYGVYDNYLQTWYPNYATNNEEVQIPILCPRRNAELIISSGQVYVGFYDGFVNDNVRSFSTRLRSTEIWTYLNADTGDSHPLHFHLTSGFAYKNLSNVNSTPNTPGSLNTPGLTLTYSRDIFQIGPQQSLSFALTWPFYPSEDSTISPFIPNIGGVIHCHFLPHNDANSMIISYAVKEHDYFMRFNH